MTTQTHDWLKTTEGRPLLVVYARLATTANVNLTTDVDDGSTIDGVTVAAGDVLLIKDHATGATKGLYVAPAASGTATRHHLMPVGAEVHGVCVRVLEGTANGNKTFWCQAAEGAATVGTDALTFATDAGGGGVTDHGALTGLTDADHPAGAIAFTSTDKLLGRSSSGAGAGEEVACTAAGRALLDDADAAAQRTTLGLGSLATVTPTGTPDGTKFLRDDNSWQTPAGGGSDLADLGDVDLTGLADEDLLRWDSGAGKWVPETPQSVSLPGLQFLLAADETDSSEHNTSTAESGAHKTYNLAANSYDYIKIEAIVQARVEQDATTKADFTWRFKEAGATVTGGTFTQRITANSAAGADSGNRQLATLSVVIAGGQVGTTALTITSQQTLSNANTGSQVLAWRVYGYKDEALSVVQGPQGPAGGGSRTSYGSSVPGSITWTAFANYSTVYCRKITVASAAYLVGIAAYLRQTVANVPSGFHAAIYEDNSGQPGRLIGIGAAGYVPGGYGLLLNVAGGSGDPRWLTLPVNADLAAGSYWIGYHVGGNAAYVDLATDGTAGAGSGLAGTLVANSSGAWIPDGTDSAYATWTATANSLPTIKALTLE